MTTKEAFPLPITNLCSRITVPSFCERCVDDAEQLLADIQAVQDLRTRDLSQARQQPRQTKSATRNKAKRRKSQSDVNKLAKLLEGLSEEQIAALMAQQGE